MTIYYRDEMLCVSSKVIQADGHVYPLAELDAVWLEYGRWRLDRLLGVLLLRLLVGVAGVALVAAVVAVVMDVHHPTGGALPVWVVYGYVFSSPAVLGVLIHSASTAGERGARELLLRARFRGEEMTLLTTTNATRFGQVHRAVRRALERASRAD
jgi:hypothetical protein